MKLLKYTRFQKLRLFILSFSFALINHLSAQNTVPDDLKAYPWLKQYSEFKEYNGVFVVKNIVNRCRNYETYLLDKKGNKLTPAYRDIGPFSNGLAEFVPMEMDVHRHGLHGFIDRNGRVVVPARYIGTDKFYGGETWVMYHAGKQYGLSFIDTSGKEIYKIPVQFFKNDFLSAKATVDWVCNEDTREDIIWYKKGEIFLLNWNFSRFIEAEIKKSKRIYHFLYKGKYGIIDKNLILRIPVALDSIDAEYVYSGQGLERVKYGDKVGFIHQFTGELVVPFLYTDSRKPTAGLFWVKKDGKWGCIDKTGRIKIPFRYDEATGFTSEDRSAVAINGKFGHIDKSGRVRIPLKFDFASYYNYGISMIRMGNKYGYMDINGRYITEVNYDNALPFDRKTTTAERNGIRYELTLDGKETFIGFTAWADALLILLGLLLIITINNFVLTKIRRRKANKS